jgi:hypothetical protein
MELADHLCQLTRERRVVALRGASDPGAATRVAEPHAVYIGSNNRGFVDFFQRAGFSQSGGLPGWRRFALSDIATLTPLDEVFEPRPDYHPENRAFYRAFVCAADDPLAQADDTQAALDAP